MARLESIVSFLDDHLDSARFGDVALNGLQVEGTEEVRKLALGVSSSQRFFDEALAWGADALLVHHGLFWGSLRPIVGPLARRLRTLLRAEISLLAYHLPLDAHPIDGNNAVIARGLGADSVEPWGEYRGREIGAMAVFEAPRPRDRLIGEARALLNEHLVVLGATDGTARRVAVCSGSGGSMLEQAIAGGADVLVTGEPGEPAQELALESGLLVIGAGHYNTERFGVSALGERLQRELAIETRFIDVPNPV